MPAQFMRAFSFHSNHLPHFLLGRIKSVAFCGINSPVVTLKVLLLKLVNLGVVKTVVVRNLVPQSVANVFVQRRLVIAFG